MYCSLPPSTNWFWTAFSSPVLTFQSFCHWLKYHIIGYFLVSPHHSFLQVDFYKRFQLLPGLFCPFLLNERTYLKRNVLRPVLCVRYLENAAAVLCKNNSEHNTLIFSQGAAEKRELRLWQHIYSQIKHQNTIRKSPRWSEKSKRASWPFYWCGLRSVRNGTNGMLISEWIYMWCVFTDNTKVE